MSICPVVRIKSTDLETQGEFVEINEGAFDPEKGHELYVPAEDAADAQPSAAAKAVEAAKKGKVK